jgi:putative N6-adenine-specific DNA methylase
MTSHIGHDRIEHKNQGVNGLDWIATTSFALEGVTARELGALEIETVDTQASRVLFKGGFEEAARASLCLRTAGHVRLVAGSFRAETFEELFEGTKALPWGQWIRKDYAFPVTCRSVNSKLFSLSDCQAIVKKAIVERLKSHYSISWFDEKGPAVDIEAHIHKDIVTLSIDTSGEGLHMRGYRKLNGPAALRETLAASLVLLTKWRGDRPFADPLCGTGTIAIEAAMVARNMAPGINRSFAAERLEWFPKEAFAAERQRAKDVVDTAAKLDIYASDIDSEAISMAKYHAKAAGVANDVRIERAALKDFTLSAPQGHLITNPPYGERMGDRKSVEALYKELGALYNRLDRWAFHVITSTEDFEWFFGRRSDGRRELRNGQLKCRYYEFYRH